MLKLYSSIGSETEYWETWETSRGNHTIHWGVLGTRGETRTVKSGFLSPAEKKIHAEIDRRFSEGFAPVPNEDHAILMIEYLVDGMGTEDDLAKRYRLEGEMNELLGWTGLGACDGGSVGSGTMEVCNFVVDFEVARRVIEEDLAGSEFGDYNRIYDERSSYAHSDSG